MSEIQIRSKFNREEKFNYQQTPKHFESITDYSIKVLKRNSVKTVSAMYNGEYPPQSLQAMVETINGNFDIAYAQLEGDYGARKTNLKQAFINGLADLKGILEEYKEVSKQYEEKFNEYANLEQQLTGNRPSDKNINQEEAVREYESKLHQLKQEK